MTFPLVCSICHKPYTGEDIFSCPFCGGSIEVDYDLAVQKEELRTIIEQGGHSGIWCYRKLLPVDEMVSPVSLFEGNTPLLHAENLERLIGCGSLYLKNETANPSGTYKDRFASVAITLAKSKNVSAVALGSAGNAAAAVSAFAAKAQIPCFVFLPTGAVRERAYQTVSYGTHLILMEGTIDDCILTAHWGESLFGWKNVGTAMRFHPFGSEGYKTIAYELGRQLNFDVPDWIVCPFGGGTLFNKIYKGYKDMLDLGLIDKLPKFAAMQAEGCAPLVQAFRENRKTPERWKNPNTIAFAIADVDAFEGVTALDIIRTTHGVAETVNDNEIISAMHMTAKKEGVLAEPASATTIAGVKKLLRKNVIKKDDSVACIISGSALRDLRLFSFDDKSTPSIRFNDESALISAVSSYNMLPKQK